MNRKTLKTALIDSLPVMTGYVFLGFGFGIVMQHNGYGLLWVLAMSLFVFAGSMQYVGVSLLTGGASLLSTALTTLMVNARHLFYGISMIEAYKGAGRKKPYLIFALTDETYSLVSREPLPEGIHRHWYFFLVSLLNQCYWVTGSVLGSLAGGLPVDFTGIDFALTALFVTIFVDQWLNSTDHRPALTGIGSAAACLFLFGPANFLIPTMVLIAAILILFRKPEKEAANA